MKDSHKTRLLLVVSANLVLSVAIGLVIWSGANNPKKVESNKNLSEVTALGQSSIAESKLSAARNDASASTGAAAAAANLEKYASTNRLEAIAEARRGAGRTNPMEPVSNDAENGLASQKPARVVVNPPPRPMISYLDPSVLPTPPLPPVEPLPPLETRRGVETPLQKVYRKLAGLKITGIIGNKAMLLMRREGSRRSDRPEIVCLAPGEQVRTMNNVPISVLQVEKDTVTLDVDGDRLVKTLPEIR